MFPVNDNDSLSRVTTYELMRGNDTIAIRVEYCLVGAMAGIFSAFPYAGDDVLSDDFWGDGDSEQAALRDCLAKIHNLAPQQIRDRN